MWHTGRSQTHFCGHQAGPDKSGRVISPTPMRNPNHCVSQWPGTRIGRGVWCRINRTWTGRWLSDVPNVKGRACVITLITLPIGTCKSHNSTKENVTLLASRFNKASARPLAVAWAVPNDVSLLYIAHSYIAIIIMCHPCGFARLDRVSRADISTASLNMADADDALRGTSIHEQEAHLLLSRMYTVKHIMMESMLNSGYAHSRWWKAGTGGRPSLKAGAPRRWQAQLARIGLHVTFSCGAGALDHACTDFFW